MTLAAGVTEFQITGLVAQTTYTIDHIITTVTTAGESDTSFSGTVTASTLGERKVIIIIDNTKDNTLPPVVISPPEPVVETDEDGNEVILAANPKMKVDIPAGTFPPGAA